MNTMTQDEVQLAVLADLFEVASSTGGFLESAQIAVRLGLPEARVGMALRTLEGARLVRGKHNYITGSSYEISENGYREIEAQRALEAAADQAAEAAIEQPEHDQSVEQLVPASDRIVTLDHNNPDLAKAISDAKQLAAQIQASNDVGNMSPEAVAVAVDEIGQIAISLEGPAVRMPSFGNRVVSTLTWIGKEAAGALVGAAALGLLALLATILGIAL